MTLQNMVELVLQVAPEMGDPIVTLQLNQAYRTFCSETRFLRGSANVNLIAGTFIYALPVTVEAMTSIDVLDSDGVELPQDVSYTVKDRFVSLTDASGELLSVLPLNASVMRVSGILIPAELAAFNTSPVTPNQFHSALVSRVIEGVAVARGNMPMAQYHMAVYKQSVHDAKILAAHNGDDTAYQPTIATY
jgi:hypothetical protein